MKREAAILVFARLANYGVMLLSPLFLVRLLSVEQFGEYREFMLYAGILQWIAGFSINDSLLYFIPANPDRIRSFIRSSMLLVAGVSGLLVTALLVTDAALHGSLLGWFALPLALYLFAFANFDFWEGLFLAEGRTTAVLVYSTVRLAARMIVVVAAAAIWRDVLVIAWALVATEVVRLLISAVAWWLWDRRQKVTQVLQSAREQWRFCAQTGMSRLVIMLNRNAGALLIARLLGPVPLARYTVATYPEPAVGAISKSVFMVTLPEIVRRRRTSGNAALDVWKRGVSWVCAGMFPLLVLFLVRAEDFIHVAFGIEYVAAAPLLQAFVIVMARNCVDFATPMQAIGETRPLLKCNVASLLVNAAALAVLMPWLGALGAVLAFAISTLVEPLVLAPMVMRRYGQRFASLLDWRELGRILTATVVAGLVAAMPRIPGLPLALDLLVASAAASLAYLAMLLVQRSECAAIAITAVRQRAWPARSRAVAPGRGSR